jgi:vacuolar-type H+-ATPase subunit I/STV1
MASTSANVETFVVEANVAPVVGETKKKSRVAKPKVDAPKSVPDVVAESLSTEGTIEFLMSSITHLQRRANEKDNEMEHLKARVAYLEEKLEASSKVNTKETKEPKEAKEKKTREPTAYNIFMKSKLIELKETHKELSNIDRMKLAAEAWTESKK